MDNFKKSSVISMALLCAFCAFEVSCAENKGKLCIYCKDDAPLFVRDKVKKEWVLNGCVSYAYCKIIKNINEIDDASQIKPSFYSDDSFGQALDQKDTELFGAINNWIKQLKKEKEQEKIEQEKK